MPSLRRLLALSATLLAASALAPGVAPAASPPAMHLSFRAADGDLITVTGFGQTVGLSVARLRPSQHSGAAATYIARGELGADGIRADLGSFGQVSMRFQPSGKIRYGRRHRNCVGPHRTITRLGHFVGSLRFRGEDGYVSVRVHRVAGRTRSPVALRCSGSEEATTEVPPSGRSLGHSKLTHLDAGFRLGPHSVHFQAEGDPRHHAHYFAVEEESEGQIAIYRYAFAQASRRTFATDSALSFASVSPPAPFGGTGTLQRAANGARLWAGSLAVAFLGEPNAPLTGSQFKTRLARGF